MPGAGHGSERAAALLQPGGLKLQLTFTESVTHCESLITAIIQEPLIRTLTAALLQLQPGLRRQGVRRVNAVSAQLCPQPQPPSYGCAIARVTQQLHDCTGAQPPPPGQQAPRMQTKRRSVGGHSVQDPVSPLARANSTPLLNRDITYHGRTMHSYCCTAI